MTLDEVKWQRVEQFVAEGDAGQRVGEEFVGAGDEAGDLLKPGESRLLRGVEQGKWLGNGVFQRGKSLRIEPGDRSENIGGEGAVVRAALDDPPFFR